MDTGLPNHGDAFNVFLVDAEVGAPDGDGDSSLQGTKTGDDLDGGYTVVGVGVYRKKGFEMDFNRLVAQ